MANEQYNRSAESGPITSQYGTVTFDAAAVPAASVVWQTVTIPAAEVGDIVLLGAPAAGVGVGVSIGVGYVSAANTAKVPFTNPTAGALDAASLTFDYYLLKKAG